MLKLSPKDRAVLFFAQNNPDCPAAELARLVGTKEHTARYALKRLTENEVIRRQAVVNLSALGFEQYQLMFALATLDKETRPKVIDFLIKDERVWLVLEHGGDFELSVLLAVERGTGLQDFLLDLGSVSNGAIYSKSFSRFFAFYGFGRKYLVEEGSTLPITVSESKKVYEIDELDTEILTTLSTDGALSKRELARVLGAPGATIDYRLNRLIENGILVGFVYGVRCCEYGYSQYRLKVYAKGISSEFLEQFYSFCKIHKSIVNMSVYFGEWDYELTVETQTHLEALEVAREIQGNFSSVINQVRVLPIFHYHKIKPFIRGKVERNSRNKEVLT